MLALNELKRLHDIGLALIYLRPKEKRPFESKWTTQPKKSWNELKDSFDNSYNLGVRLGEASCIEGKGYLACIDIDIKDPKYKGVALAKLKELVGDATYPEVRSGSGNGSRHLYCVTPEPFKMVTIAKYDQWEICIYSTGRQMVLPPSIHPDTGSEYVWRVPLSMKNLPVFDVSQYVKNTKSEKSPPLEAGLKVEEVDLHAVRPKLKFDLIELITVGTDKGERSEAIFTVALSLCRAGLTDGQILSVLSNPAYGISEKPIEARGGRLGAIDWLREYALKPARHETDIMRRFANPPKLEKFSGKEVTQLKKEIVDENSALIRAQGFYSRGKKGALKPEYDELLKVFKGEKPYRTIADMKSVFAFQGTHYVDLTPLEIKAFAESKFNPKPEDKLRCEFYNKVLANNVVRRNFFCDTIENRINFKNGVLDLNSQKLEKHSEVYGFRGVLPYGYNPNAKCPFFKKWIHELMLYDKELVQVLQEFMGYIVRGGDYKYHKALWLGGVGRNGKSTFVDVLKALIGAGNFSVLSIKALVGDKFAGADLDGKIANFSEETSPQELADSGPFKNLTGDGDLFAQKKYGDPYSFRNKAKLVMTYNTIPDLKDLSSGMLSRPIIIPFKKELTEYEQDKTIKGRILEELPGIFNFAMRGWKRLETQGGFTHSTESALALEIVKQESCNVYQWVEDHVKKADDPRTKIKPIKLYEAYAFQERYPFKKIEFCRRMNRHPLIKNCKNKNDEEGVSYRVGLI